MSLWATVGDPDLVYLETSAGGRYIEDRNKVREFREDFTSIREQSIPIEEHLHNEHR